MGFYRGPKIVTDGLVLYLDAANPKSYPGTGVVWNDLSGNGNDGILINGPSFNSGNGGSIMFDGVNDYIRVTNNPSLAPNNFTISVWVIRNFGRTILSLSNDSSGAFKLYSFEVTTSFIAKLRTTDNDYSITTTLPSQNIWYNYVSTYNGNTFSLYVNGVLTNSTPASGTIDLGSANLNIGNKNTIDGEYINGKISNFILYNKPLTLTEIQQNYNATKSRFGH